MILPKSLKKAKRFLVDRQQAEEFGFGLSYTTFELSKPRAPKAFPADKPLKVSVTLTNTGDREGAEVVQLYVTENAPTVLRPKKELKGFRTVPQSNFPRTKV